MADPSSDTDTESSTSSDYTYLMPGASDGIEKLTKTEMAHKYAQQMKTMVTHYESFINEMQELSLRTGTGTMKKRGVKAHTLDGGAQVVRVQNGNNNNIHEEIILPSNNNRGHQGSSAASMDRFTNTSERPSSTTASSFNLSKPCCSNNDILNKKVDAICSFVQTLFSSQVHLLGKCYQDQMEMRQRVDELRSMTEEYDEEFEYLEKEVTILRKGINDMQVFTSKSVDKKAKIIMEELKEFVKGINERTGNVGKRVDELIEILQLMQQQKRTAASSGSASEKVAETATSQPLDKGDDFGLD